MPDLAQYRKPNLTVRVSVTLLLLANVYSATTEVLSAPEEPGEVSRMMDALGHWNAEKRNAAEQALAVTQDSMVDLKLIAALNEDKSSVRASVARIIGQRAPASDAAVLALVRALKDSNSDVRIAAAASLGELGDPRAIPELQSLLGDHSGELRHAVAESLEDLADSSGKTFLRFLERPEDSAADEVEPLPHLAPAAIQLLGHWNERIQERAAEMLLGMGEEALEPLLEALHSAGPRVRDSSVYILTEIGNEAAGDAVFQATNDPSIDVRRISIRRLARVKKGNEVFQRLSDALSDPDEWTQNNAIYAFGDLGDPRAMPLLLGFLQADDPRRRAAAAKALQGLNNPLAWESLVRAADDRVPEVRIQALWAVGRIDPAGARPLLLKGLQDSFSSVRVNSADALGWYGTADDVPVLQALARNDEERGVRDMGRAAAVRLGERLNVPVTRDDRDWWNWQLLAWLLTAAVMAVFAFFFRRNRLARSEPGPRSLV